MDIRLIEYFAVLAHHLSFTRAAEQLNMPQPHLSRLIRRLEDSVGAPLVDRCSRQIALTPAGRVLLDESRAVLDQLSLAMHRTAEAANPMRRQLRIGYTALVPNLPLHHGIKAFRQAQPQVKLDFQLLPPEEQANALRAGRLDVGLFQFIDCDRTGLEWRTIGRTHFVLAIPADWPFPADQPIDLSALADRPFVLIDPAASHHIHQAQLAFCASAGFQPQVARLGRDRDELLFMTACGFGASFVFEPALRLRPDGVNLLPLADPHEGIGVDFQVFHIARNPSPLATGFIDHLSRHSRQARIVKEDQRFDICWS